MGDRFDETATEARAAIDRADARQAAAHRRGLELDERIAALRRPHPYYGQRFVQAQVTAARARLLIAEQSSERARDRAERAVARHTAPP